MVKDQARSIAALSDPERTVEGLVLAACTLSACGTD
jgi:hypothetical protein